MAGSRDPDSPHSLCLLFAGGVCNKNCCSTCTYLFSLCILRFGLFVGFPMQVAITVLHCGGSAVIILQKLKMSACLVFPLFEESLSVLTATGYCCRVNIYYI